MKIDITINRLCNYFVPEGMEASGEYTVPVNDARAGIPVIILAYIATFLGSMPMSYLFLSASNMADNKELVILASVQPVIMCMLGLIIFKRTHSTIFAAHWYALTALLAIVLPGCITGGYSHSPYFQILLLVPAWSFLTLGRTAGLIWSGISLATLSTSE